MSLEVARCRIEEVCLLAEYAVNMKSVIPDYEWTIFGVRVNQPT